MSFAPLYPDLMLFQTQDMEPERTNMVGTSYSYTVGGKSQVAADKTEFQFCVSAPGCGIRRYDDLRELGFKPVASMNNWYYGHQNEFRKLTLWWKHNKDFVRGTPYQNNHATYNETTQKKRDNYNQVYTFGAGCGFQLLSCFCPNFKKHALKFFSLLRLPPKLTEPQKRCITWLNYKCIGEGELASYWVNGFDPETYDYFKIEAPFWEEWTRKYGKTPVNFINKTPTPLPATVAPVAQAAAVLTAAQVKLDGLNVRPRVEVQHQQTGEAAADLQRGIPSPFQRRLRMYSPVYRPRRRVLKSLVDPPRRRARRRKAIGD